MVQTSKGLVLKVQGWLLLLVVHGESAGINQKWLCNAAAVAGRAVVLLSLQLFGVNNAFELLLWQEEDCSCFCVSYK